MRTIPQYHFHKTKYGEELLIDLVELSYVKKYIPKEPVVHTLTYFDITFVTAGSGYFNIDDKQYVINPGDVIFSKPGEVRSWDINNIKQGYALIFEEEFLLSFFNDPYFIQNLSYFTPGRTSAKMEIISDKERIESLIRQVLIEIKEYKSRDTHILRALLYEMLMFLNRQYVTNNPVFNETVNSNRYINTFVNLVNENFRIHHDTKYYAERLCITPNYLNELVQRIMGVNAKLYIQNKILLEVKRLLTYTNMSISEIADNLYFNNTSYFIRFFRAQTTITPLQYRNNQKR